ncbi:MAG: DUF4055 domain-containing protein [candidate division Zixibacteria bacterium]|nr:DUF4055 domain-containing protein [candidate division Zixibacteria bacterium]
MPVDSQHQEYSNNLPKWTIVRDCDEGSQAIKKRSKGGSNTLSGMAGTAYLPAPNSSDTSDENRARYYAYLERANFVNFTGHTKEGLIGLVFRKKTNIEAPTDIEYLVENANGDGLTTDQMIKDATGEVLMAGRYGLLTEYPDAPEGLTEAQVRALELRANIISWPAESVINWRSQTIGGIKKLSMVVLVEPREITEDGFEYKIVTYHRVLLLKEIDGKLTYVQNVYDDKGSLEVWKTGDQEDGEDGYTGDIVPRKNDGSTWSEIPFTFIGSINNDAKVDKAPLYDIAEVNISHYRNSADYEESSFMVGQPTLVLSGLTASWVKDVLDGKIGLGSRGAIMLPVGGAADLMQADPNQMPSKGMEMKEAQITNIGAQIIKDSGSNEAEETVRIRFIGQNSKLGSIIQNVESAFLQAYAWAQEFQGGTGEAEITINREFYPKSIDPQAIMANIALLDRGVIAKKDLRTTLRASELIDPDRTDDEIDGEAEEASPIT